MAVTPYAMSHELHGCYREAMQKLTFDQPPCFITKGTALPFAFNKLAVGFAVICHSLTSTHTHGHTRHTHDTQAGRWVDKGSPSRRCPPSTSTS
jgi:hypothetical protein